MKPKFMDLADEDEDKRIDLIGNKLLAMASGRTVGVVVDGDKTDPGKADRYIKKLIRKFPVVTRWEIHRGPDMTVIKIFAP